MQDASRDDMELPPRLVAVSNSTIKLLTEWNLLKEEAISPNDLITGNDISLSSEASAQLHNCFFFHVEKPQ